MMKRDPRRACLFAVFAAVLVATAPAVAQPGYIGVYSDPAGYLCTAPDDPSGTLSVYIIHQATAGAGAVQAGLECTNPSGFVHLGETSPYATMIGSMWVHDDGAGGSIAYGACVGSPNLIKTVNLLPLGDNPECTTLSIVPDPQSLTGTIEVIDCANNKLVGEGDCMWINPAGGCNDCYYDDCSGEPPPPPGPNLYLTPWHLDFGSESELLTFGIQNVGGGVLEWHVSPGASWMAVSDTAGTQDATIEVTVDRAGLAAATYNSTIEVTSNGGDRTIDVSMTVLPPYPVLAIDPTVKTLAESEDSFMLHITNAGSGTLQWGIAPDEMWLSAAADTGSGDASILISVDRTGLPTGSYMGTVQVTSNGGDAACEVSITVGPPVLHVVPTSKTLAYNENSFNMNITNSGSGVLQWTITPDETWLSAAPDTGSGDATVLVSVDRTGLSDGTYPGALHVTSNGGDANVDVTMIVATQPILGVNPKWLSFVSSSQVRELQISNEGVSTLTWLLQPNQPWIDVAPASGSGDAQITVTLDLDSLTSPANGEIAITSNGGSATVPVNYFVDPSAGFLGLYVDPAGTDCSAEDVANGILTVYMIHKLAPEAGAVQAGLLSSNPNGFVYLGETSPFALTIGTMWIYDDLRGGSVAYAGCAAAPVHVKTISLMTLGNNPPCTNICVVPDPKSHTGTIEVVDCANNKMIGGGECLFVNVNPDCMDCAAPTPARPTTWGQIKAQFIDWDNPLWRSKNKR